MSVGLALWTDFEGCEVEEIIQEADAAVYEAKGNGRDGVSTAQAKGESKPLDQGAVIKGVGSI